MSDAGRILEREAGGVARLTIAGRPRAMHCPPIC